MTDIDWSKAPEGATHYFEPFFYKAEGPRAWLFSDQWRLSSYSTRQIDESGVKRPAPPWSGDGLPPVGTFVRITDDGSLYYGANESGEVIAHVEDCAVVRMSYGLGCFTARYLEAVKTPAQIAAEKREAAIDEMAGWAGATGLTIDFERKILGRLYDARYRRMPEGEDD